MNHDKVLIVDYGSQYTQLITRRIRELNVYSEIFPYNLNKEDIESFSPKAIILSGGPSSVYDKDAYSLSKDIVGSGVPILGICYGLQLLVHNMGGNIISKNRGEYGLSSVSFDATGIFSGLTIYAIQTKYDYTSYGGIGIAMLLGLIMFGLFTSFVQIQLLRIMYSVGGSLIFSFYIVYDTQLITGGTERKIQYTVDDFALASVNLYLDITNLFLLMLNLLSGRN